MVKIIKFAKTLDRKLTGFSFNPNPGSFQDLAPSIDPEGNKTYTNAINWAIKSENIKNIGLTGPYGSGKSSILKTFENEFPEYSYLNISLASFEEKEENPPTDKQLIELSIMQQIFYHEKAKDIPDSRFKRIKNLKSSALFLWSAYLILWGISVLYLFNPKLFTGNSHFKAFFANNESKVFYASVLITMIGAFLLVKALLRTVNKTKLQKLNLTSGEFEIGDKNETSILNKHLDEILYFFQATPYEIVILEDIDRFKDPEIFTKLREINLVLNNSKQISRKIVFIYAIKDEMFVKANRTKFFDFIIPVIPVINASNSGDMLMSWLRTENAISPNFINDVAMYIEDMRMLKNICNEFELYKAKIGTNLNLEKLFAIIIYKNIYPSDFSDLHANRGMVYEIFSSKNKLISSRVEEIDKKIEACKKEIELLEGIVAKDEKELRAIYLQALIELMHPNYTGQNILINGVRRYFGELNNENLFNEITGMKQFYYQTPQGYKEIIEVSFKEIEKSVDAVYSFYEKRTLLTNKNNGKIYRLKTEIIDLVYEKNSILGWSLQDIIQSVSLVDIDNPIKGKKLLMYLIRNGYIDEMYASYISYFYEGSITRDDLYFLMCVKNHSGLNFDFVLQKKPEIIKRLHYKEYNQKEVLNIQLVDFLFENKEWYQQQLDVLVDQLGNKSDVSTQFIDIYLQKGKKVADFVNTICSLDILSWDELEDMADFTNEKGDFYLQLILKYADIRDIVKLDKSSRLSGYIRSSKNFLILFPDGEFISKIEDVLAVLEICFERIEYSNKAENLFNFIYAGQFYDINANMIDVVITQKESNQDLQIKDLQIFSYYRILKSDCAELRIYINENIEYYVQNVFLPHVDILKEPEEGIVELLNQIGISFEIKEEVIKKIYVLKCYIDDLPESIWAKLLNHVKIQCTWYNLLIYFKTVQRITEPLIYFLNQRANYLDFPLELEDSEKSKIIDWEEQEDILIEKLVTCSSLEMEPYKVFLDSISGWTYDNIDISGLQSEQVSLLIESRVLAYTKENYLLVNKYFKSLVVDFIVKNIDNFLRNPSDYEIDKDQFYGILVSNKIAELNKLAVAALAKEQWIAIDSRIRNEIFELSFTNRTHKWSYAIVDALVKNIPESDRKIKAIVYMINGLQLYEITFLLRLLGEPYINLVMGKRSKVKLDYSPSNQELAEELVKIYYVSSFKIKGKIIGIWNKS